MENWMHNGIEEPPGTGTKNQLGPGGTGVSPGLEDERIRRRAFVRLGVVLLVGFLLPMVIAGDGGLRLIFVNILVLGQGGAPIVTKFWHLYPAIAGIAAILLAVRGKGIARGIVLMLMGMLAVVISIRSGSDAELPRLGGGLSEFSTGSARVVALLAMVGIYVGSRARCFRPRSTAAAIVGAVGGGVYLLTLVLPTQPKEVGTIPLLTPLKLILDAFHLYHMPPRFLIFTGFVSLAAMMLLIAAAILCLQNVEARPDAAHRARGAFALWVASVVPIAFIALYGPINRLITGVGEGAVGALLTEFADLVKTGLWAGGILLMIPMGATDLLVSLSRAERARAVADRKLSERRGQV